jgi:VanZ family protein
MSSRKFLKYWLPVLLWLAFIFWMSTEMFSAQHTYFVIEPILRWFYPSISHKSILLIHTAIRKSAHVTEYFISGVLLFRAFRAGSTEPRSLRWALLSVLVVIVIAASDEFHQSLVFARTPSIIDVGIDTLGGILAQCVSILVFRRRR